MPDGLAAAGERPAVVAGPAAVLGIDLSLGGRRWVWRHVSAAGVDLAGQERRGLAVAQRLAVPEMVGRLLAMRGIDAKTAVHFLEPDAQGVVA